MEETEPDRRARVPAEIEALRVVRDEIAAVLSAGVLETMDELIANDEPNEALLVMAWGIASNRVDVALSVLEFIEGASGTPLIYL